MIRVLMVEDARADAELALRELKRAGLAAEHRVVETEAGFRSELAGFAPDVILSDFSMPAFDGMRALDIAREAYPEIPFIFVSGTLGEEYAIRALKNGATDYVLKTNLQRLPASIERALKESRERDEKRLTERRLRESEERHRAMFEQAAVGIVHSTLDGRLLAFNPKFADISGYSRDQAGALTIGDLTHPDDIDRSVDGRARMLTGSAVPYERELRLVCKDGTHVWVHITTSLVRAPDDQPSYFISVVHDISERKQAEHALQQFRMAMDVTVDSIYLTDPSTMRFVYLNQTACERLGYTREQLLQKGPQDVLPLDREQLRREYDEVIAAGEQGLRQERTFVRSDGSEGWTDLHRRALRTEGGTLIVTVGRDISERRALEQRNGAIVKALGEITYDWRPLENRLLWTGDYTGRLGYSAEEMGQDTDSWTSRVHPDDLEKVLAEVAASTRERRIYDLEYRFRHRDGSHVWMHDRGVPFVNSEGQLSRIIGVFSGIGERKETEARIGRLNRVYAVLSGINAVIARVTSRAQLFQQACRIAVDAGKFRLAWIGVVNWPEKRVDLAASAGDAKGYLENMPLIVSLESGEGHGMINLAVHEATAMVCNDVATDPRILIKAAALERGFRSIVALPVSLNGKVAAVITLYAEQSGFFDAEEMKLLNELAGDLSFALDHIEKANKLDYLAYYDALTGLANRSLFHERLSQYVHAAQQRQGKLALVLANVERFKAVNDSLGRQAGDELLKQIAARLGKAVDPADIARIGGDHFAIALPEVKGRSAIGRAAQAIWRDCFTQPFKVNDTELRVGARAGIALYPSDGTGAEALLASAEAALQKGQQTGDRFFFHTRELTAGTADQLALENRLRQALEKEEFVLHYQPKVDLESRAIVGVEALIRWQSPELGLVPPVKFIPLMEETGLILEAGTWALRRAAIDHRGWVEQRLLAPRVAVNVSSVQLRQRDFVGAVEQAIIEGVAPTGIDLEITESLLMDDLQGNIEKLNAVRALGVRVAIDDFGTGYSSLGYLAKLPVQTLKIDRSFIITMLKEPDTMTLVQTMITLAHSLRLRVVAEGVETEDQAKMLRLLRCDEMQGYLFSRPVPLEQMTALLKQAKKT